MHSRWLQSLKRLIENFVSGDREYIEDGIRVIYHREGGFTIPPSEYPKLIAHMIDEREKWLQRTANRDTKKEWVN